MLFFLPQGLIKALSFSHLIKESYVSASFEDQVLWLSVFYFFMTVFTYDVPVNLYLVNLTNIQ